MTFECSLLARRWRIDTPWPLRVKKAVMRWGDGRQFGLEFAESQLAQRGRMRALIRLTRR